MKVFLYKTKWHYGNIVYTIRKTNRTVPSKNKYILEESYTVIDTDDYVFIKLIMEDK